MKTTLWMWADNDLPAESGAAFPRCPAEQCSETLMFARCISPCKYVRYWEMERCCCWFYEESYTGLMRAECLNIVEWTDGMFFPFLDLPEAAISSQVKYRKSQLIYYDCPWLVRGEVKTKMSFWIYIDSPAVIKSIKFSICKPLQSLVSFSKCCRLST